MSEARAAPARRALAWMVTALFLPLAPGTLAVYIPWRISAWRLRAFSAAYLPLQIAGGLLVAVGLGVLLESFARFAWKGQGSPAPVLPPEHLVVSGTYRFVRNPIYIAVTSAILGQAMAFASIQLLEYGALLWVFFHIVVLVYEEPTLRETFGEEYERLCANVPRWIPRLRP